MNDKLSEAAAQRLLRFFNTGDPGGGPFATMELLKRQGYVAFDDKKIRVTEKGRAWCLAHHLEY